MRPFRLVGIVLVFSLAAGPLAAAQKPAAAPAPDTSGYYFLLARHLENSKKIEEAIDALKKAIELSPRSAELRAELAGVVRPAGSRARSARNRRSRAAAGSRQPRGQQDPRIGLRRTERAAAGLPSRRRPCPVPGQGDGRTRKEPARRRVGHQSRIDAGSALSPGRRLRQGDVQPAASRRRSARLSRGRDAPAAAQEEAGQTDDAIEHARSSRSRRTRNSSAATSGLPELYEQQRRFQDAADAYAQAQAANPRVDLGARRPPRSSTPGKPAQARDLLQAAIARKTAPDAASLYMLGAVAAAAEGLRRRRRNGAEAEGRLSERRARPVPRRAAASRPRPKRPKPSPRSAS